MGNTWFEMIKYARERHIWVRSITNGSLLHLKENYKRIIDSDVCELQVSIDGATKHIFEKIRRGAKFKQIAENCIMLNKYASQNREKRTRMWCLIQKDNFHELDKIVAISKEWGFERLTFGLNVEDQGWKKGETDMITSLNMVDRFSYENAENLIRIGKKLGVNVTFWGTSNKFDYKDSKNLCPWPFERVVVSSDMRIVPCCMVANPQIYDLGDATKLDKEWDSKLFDEFRQCHIDGDLPKICESCYI
jgi:pyrroloquinoline quinone biosynthesis protein E